MFAAQLDDVEMETELMQLLKPMGLSTQLQALRKALHDRYLQEVAALRDEHRTQLEHLAQGPGADTPEPASLMESLEKQHQEKVEVEIAKVGPSAGESRHTLRGLRGDHRYNMESHFLGLMFIILFSL